MKLFRHPISKFACLLNWLMIPVSSVFMFAMALSFAGHWGMLLLASLTDMLEGLGWDALIVVVICQLAIYALIVTGIVSLVGFLLSLLVLPDSTISAFTGKPYLLQQLVVTAVSAFYSVYYVAAIVFRIYIIAISTIHPLFMIYAILCLLLPLAALPVYAIWTILSWSSMIDWVVGFVASIIRKRREKIKDKKVKADEVAVDEVTVSEVSGDVVIDKTVEELAPVETPALESADETALPDA